VITIILDFQTDSKGVPFPPPTGGRFYCHCGYKADAVPVSKDGEVTTHEGICPEHGSFRVKFLDY
jgi:hypothetical protein